MMQVRVFFSFLVFFANKSPLYSFRRYFELIYLDMPDHCISAAPSTSCAACATPASVQDA